MCGSGMDEGNAGGPLPSSEIHHFPLMVPVQSLLHEHTDQTLGLASKTGSPGSDFLDCVYYLSFRTRQHFSRSAAKTQMSLFFFCY